MRIGLLNEGTYPVARGGVTTWCEHLVAGLPQHQFIPVTLVAQDERVVLDLPANVPPDEVTLIPMWGRVAGPPPLAWHRHGRRLRGLLRRLWAAVLPAQPDSPGNMEEFVTVLKELTGWDGPPLARLVDRDSSTRWILQAWHGHRESRPDLPELTLAEAGATAVFVDRMVAVADAEWPDVDVTHLATNSPPALLALGRRWQRGTPIVLTEHGIYLRERHLALGETSMAWASRYVVGAFLRMLAQATYAEATRIAPVSDFNRQWELRMGADPARTTVIPNGVDVDRFHPLVEEPDVPTVSFVGRIDPLKGLEVMLDAFALVHERLPEARLRLFGPTPKGDEDYRARLETQVDQLGLRRAVTFEGRVESSMEAFRAGHVVALSSISEGLPFTVIEAMMAGRATVNTDVGGVAEVIGPDGLAGSLVPPRDPRALADGLLALLQDDDLRHEMGRRARERALALFDLRTFVRRYGEVYEHALVGTDPDDVILARLEEDLVGAGPDPTGAAAAEPAGQPDPDGPGRAPRRNR